MDHPHQQDLAAADRDPTKTSTSGPRLDELIHRSRPYREFQGDPVIGLPFIPRKEYGSLPSVPPDQKPNPIRIDADSQPDFLLRLYVAGASVVGAEHGPDRPRSRWVILELADDPATTSKPERESAHGG